MLPPDLLLAVLAAPFIIVTLRMWARAAWAKSTKQTILLWLLGSLCGAIAWCGSLALTRLLNESPSGFAMSKIHYGLAAVTLALIAQQWFRIPTSPGRPRVLRSHRSTERATATDSQLNSQIREKASGPDC